jgi:endonuclease-3
MMNTKQLAAEVHQLLVDEFGLPDWRPHLSPVGELVSTILSQNTNDTNRDVAYDALRKQFPTWELVRDAPEKQVIDAIRPAGLANQKGPAIQNALRVISAERGRIELDFLTSLSNQQAANWLLQLKGVGPKTAAIVMLFSLQMPAFPVDTHVYRVTGRLGLRPDRMNANQAHSFLADQFHPETYYPVHLNLIRLGREICTARKPACASCPLNKVCDYYENQSKEI